MRCTGSSTPVSSELLLVPALGGISCGLSFLWRFEGLRPLPPFITGTLHKAIPGPFQAVNRFTDLQNSKTRFALNSGEIHSVDFKKS
jgi:hypothetical protein